jgi:glycerophosphoryl diester phosphodiesterase
MSAATACDWLIARPIAHRGRHATFEGIVENSLPAAQAAVHKGWAIECDVQMSADEEAFVFHDETLERLTHADGRIEDLPAQVIAATPYRDGTGTIPRLNDFFDCIAGRVPLIVEIKSRFDADMRLAERVARLAARYHGPLALQSFDPNVLKYFRACGMERPLGLIAQAVYDGPEWSRLSEATRRALTTFADYSEIRPDFLAWSIEHLPHATAALWRHGLARPLLTWTVRTQAQADRAASYADQIIFEGFEPAAPAG